MIDTDWSPHVGRILGCVEREYSRDIPRVVVWYAYYDPEKDHCCSVERTLVEAVKSVVRVARRRK